MEITATKSPSSFVMWSTLAATLISASCTHQDYVTVFTARSPNGSFVARLERLEEGTLGSTRYRLFVSRADGSDSMEAFRGTNAWVAPPIWQNPSTLIVPFCFGSIDSVTSVLPLRAGEKVHYRSSSSANLRVHILTAPHTQVNGVEFCNGD